MWIEVFSTGDHQDSSGEKRSYSSEDLKEIAEKYNKRILEDVNSKAPIVKGHPKNDEPAVGWVNRLALRSNKLIADLELYSDFNKEFENGNFKNVSISFYDNFKLKHIGFLGAVNPAVEGLKKLEFSKIDDPINHYEQENIILKEKVNSLEKESRLNEFRKFANDLFEKENNFITPAQIGDVVDLLELAYNADSKIKEFAKNDEFFSYSEKLRNLISAKNLLNLKQEIKVPKYFEKSEFLSKNLNDERLIIHNNALEILSRDPMLSYEEAINKSMNYLINL